MRSLADKMLRTGRAIAWYRTRPHAIRVRRTKSEANPREGKISEALSYSF